MGWVGFYNRDIGHSRFEQYQLGGDGLSNFTIEGFDCCIFSILRPPGGVLVIMRLWGSQHAQD